MMTDNRAGLLADVIEAVGLMPVVAGVRGTPAGPEIVFAPEATREQRDQAAAIVAAFDARPRRRRPLASIAQDIAGLSAADRNRLVAAVCAAYLQDHPGFARTLSLAIDGDEPEG